MLLDEGFRGTKRFVIEGCLGAGGMGVVHRARDLERGEVVALKTMTRLDPEALLRFKKEFRSLADISHPNVVQLYELFSEGDQWFFTMELVDGVDLLTWGLSSMSMPPPGVAAGAGPDYAPTMPAAPSFFESLRPTAKTGPPQQVPRRFPVRDVERLRDAFRQLACGLLAIHAAGKLHRDVKPPNVIVTRAGRVVLLDFGVASDFAGRKGHGVEDSLAGTPAYMAPEQATLARATPASDWYAVGVVLYEALTTRLPFEGSAPAILFAKQQGTPPPPSAFSSGVPADLEKLAMALLHPDPRVRPTGEEVLAQLEGQRVAAAISTPAEAAFVGRRDQLDHLHAAFEASAERRVVVMLHGPSGMGKSALASRFLGELAAKQDALVLSGRCYEREAVPFKAVDSVVDELRHWLARLPREDAYAFLPADLSALVRVFPVLGHLHVDSLYDSSPSLAPPATEQEDGPGHELRRRAFAAFRELLTNIARDYRLVVHIDDLQWCDADSVQLLESLFGGHDAHDASSSAGAVLPWMLLCTYRSESAETSAPLADLRKAITKLGNDCSIRELEVRELSPRECDELARALVDSDDPGVRALITSEACGNPLFLGELARWANERVMSTDDARDLSLELVILDRVQRLPPEARVLLETLSVAGGPLAQAVAARAAQLDTALRTPALALRSARMVVTRGLGDDDPIEIAHARVRETITKSLADERKKACHAGIARALTAHSRGDLDVVFEHFLAAGDLESAKSSVLAAAEAAEQSLAFLRAAKLYRHAIRLRAGALGVLHQKLGDALANAEHLGDAADAYLAGAAHASPALALELRRLAAEDYLKSGRDERGLSVLIPVLAEVGLPYPRSQQRALASILWHEAKLRAAPLRRRLRSPQSLRTNDLVRIDVAYAAATGLSMSDPLRGVDYASRGLWLALETGEPVRTCRALAVAAGNTASRGEGARRRAEELARAAQRIAGEIDDPRTRALAHFAAGVVHFLLGEWRAARASFELAEGTLRENCRAVAWELATTQSWTLNALILTGDLQAASRRAPLLMEEARGREDRFATMHLVYPTCISRLAADDVAGALEFASVGRAGDPGVLTAGQWAALISACSVERYRGDARAAWERTRAESKVLEKSMLWQSAMVRTFSCYERGLSAIAAASAGHDRRAALRAADGWARALAREKLRFAPALGYLVRAGTCAVRGNRGDALRALDAAIPALDAAELGYLAACARHRKGELLGGDAGRRSLDESRAFFTTQGIVRTDRCLAMSAPGFVS